MIMARERALIKAREEFEKLWAWVRRTDDNRLRIDQVERELFRRLLAIGLLLLKGFVARFGRGDAGKTVEHNGGRLRRLEQLHRRRYLPIYGELSVCRFVSAPVATRTSSLRPDRAGP